MQISPTQAEYLIFHDQNEAQIFLSSSPDAKLRRSSSLSELCSLWSLQLPLRAPLALSRVLLRALKQEEGSLSPLHSFYFRHTQPRCLFEV